MTDKQDRRENLAMGSKVVQENYRQWCRSGMAEAEREFNPATDYRMQGVKLLTANFLLAEQRYFRSALREKQERPVFLLSHRLSAVLIEEDLLDL